MEEKLKGEEDIRMFVGAKSGVVMPAQSASQALFRLINDAVKHFPGTNIVTTKAEHISVYDATFSAAEANCKEWRVAPFSKEDGCVHLGDIIDLVDKNTSVLALVHAANITGGFLNIATIIKEARGINNKICVIVDGVQYIPHGVIDWEKIGNPDAYVIAPYKAGGIKGTAFAILSESFSVIPHDKVIGKPKNDWDLGTIGHTNYAAWSSLVDHYCWIGSHFTTSVDRRQQIIAGMASIRAHEIALLERLFYGTKNNIGLKELSDCRKINLFFINEKDLINRGCLISYNISELNATKAVKSYLDSGILVQNRTSNVYSKHILDEIGVDEIIRFSAGHFNSPNEIDRFLEVTLKICETKKN